MLAEAFHLGSWKSIIEMEKNITMEELFLLIKENRLKEEREHQFLAAIQGIDLSGQKSENEKTFEQIQFEVEAELAGKRTDEHFFDMVGIAYEEE